MTSWNDVRVSKLKPGMLILKKFFSRNVLMVVLKLEKTIYGNYLLYVFSFDILKITFFSYESTDTLRVINA